MTRCAAWISSKRNTHVGFALWRPASTSAAIACRGTPLTTKDVCRMVKRWLKDFGLPSRRSPRSLRVTGISDLLGQGVPLDVGRPYGLLRQRCPTLTPPRTKTLPPPESNATLGGRRVALSIRLLTDASSR